MSNSIYMLVGAPGSGKSWVCSQLHDKFNIIKHDVFNDENAYILAILDEAASTTKPILIEIPFSISKFKEPLETCGHTVLPVFIIEDTEVQRQRYKNRENKEIPKGHLTRTQTYLKRAKEGNHFYGTSNQVLKHLKELK